MLFACSLTVGTTQVAVSSSLVSGQVSFKAPHRQIYIFNPSQAPFIMWTSYDLIDHIPWVYICFTLNITSCEY